MVNSFSGTADLIESLSLDALPKGVEASDGLCQNREGMDAVSTSDVAYTISDRSVASIPTAQLFPDGFPSDFSILATFQAKSQSKVHCSILAPINIYGVKLL